jgi:flotillin
MNAHLALVVAALGFCVVTLVFMAVVLSRYVKVGPNRVLIVSGRVYHLPDGTRRGFRIVKAGGTFVFPVVERADSLSLEVVSLEMPKCRMRTANGSFLEPDCLAQVKIQGDDVSIAAAAEHFLSKNEGAMKELIRPILEQHLRTVAGGMSSEEMGRDIDACARRVQAAAAEELARMGVGLVSFTIRPGKG